MDYTHSVDIDVQWNTCLEYCWRQETVACGYDNWISIVEDPLYAFNAHGHNGLSPANSDQEP